MFMEDYSRRKWTGSASRGISRDLLRNRLKMSRRASRTGVIQKAYVQRRTTRNHHDEPFNSAVYRLNYDWIILNRPVSPQLRAIRPAVERVIFKAPLVRESCVMRCGQKFINLGIPSWSAGVRWRPDEMIVLRSRRTFGSRAIPAQR